MEFEWDGAKARRNLTKHGVSFELACLVWDDPWHVVVPDRLVEGELRWHGVGLVGSVILLVVHSYPDPDDDTRVRIIGARKATPGERRRYEEDPA